MIIYGDFLFLTCLAHLIFKTNFYFNNMSKICVIFFLLLSCQVFGQNATFKSNAEFQQAMKEKAKKDIQTLKNSVVLVRIHGRSQEINYYKKYNNFEAAHKIELETQEFNRDLIKAFRQAYKFCPIYFFEDTFSYQILSGNLDKVVFYSDTMTPDTTIKVVSSNFFIAEFGITEGDTSGYRNDYRIMTNEEGSGRSTSLYKEENLHISAFVLRDKRFVMLHRPFPYYSKLFGKTPSFVRMRKKIYLWNIELQHYYGSSS